MSISCCLSYKDTILKANHSLLSSILPNNDAVAYPTKILFWKRITALQPLLFQKNKLLLILQRYYFESESQHQSTKSSIKGSCCLSYKDTILKANHSFINSQSIKITLLLILQRYYFESESQLVPRCYMLLISCCLSYKDTILKANHSISLILETLRTAVAYPTKILFWKRITASIRGRSYLISLLLILQRYYFESESQLISDTLQAPYGCCLSYKDTILKANHSLTKLPSQKGMAVAYPTKILFWKRITAKLRKGKKATELLLILQRYYFESESQHQKQPWLSIHRCCLSYKDTILKANHSRTCGKQEPPAAVAYPTKILFWKRITAKIVY